MKVNLDYTKIRSLWEFLNKFKAFDIYNQINKKHEINSFEDYKKIHLDDTLAVQGGYIENLLTYLEGKYAIEYNYEGRGMQPRSITIIEVIDY
ncbi:MULTISPECIES: hypothetical protein [Methanobacterium]|nr:MULTISPECIES: hypothetical protein [Methanobacterium]